MDTYLSKRIRYITVCILKNPFLLGLASALISVVVTSALGEILKIEDAVNATKVEFQDPMDLVGVAVIFPLAETLVFQTFIIYFLLKITKSKIVNIGVSSAVFSASHVGNATSVPIILDAYLSVLIPGIMLAYISFKRLYENQLKRSILHTWAAHATHNASILILYACAVFFF